MTLLDLTQRDARKARLNNGEWHLWFAWRPVWVDSKLVWLEPLQRKHEWSVCSAGGVCATSYRRLAAAEGSIA